jgi:serine/threonine-protein phosphatase 2A regulatory subunit B'
MTLPMIKDIPISNRAQRKQLYIMKLRACHQIFSFKDAKVNTELKDKKRETLLEIVDYLDADPSFYEKEILSEAFKMINVNLFRTLGNSHSPSSKT